MTAGEKRSAALYLDDIIAAARDLVEYTSGISREAFLADRMRQRAVVQCFEVIGEASKKLPQALRQQHPDIPWRYMAAFRDKLIHDYFEVDQALVWTTSIQEIPAVLAKLEVVAALFNESGT